MSTMRSLGLIGLVLALLVVGVLVKKQMAASVPMVAPAATAAPADAAVPTVRAQSQQIQQQVREQLDAAAQARPMPDEAK